MLGTISKIAALVVLQAIIALLVAAWLYERNRLDAFVKQTAIQLCAGEARAKTGLTLFTQYGSVSRGLIRSVEAIVLLREPPLEGGATHTAVCRWRGAAFATPSELEYFSVD